MFLIITLVICLTSQVLAAEVQIDFSAPAASQGKTLAIYVDTDEVFDDCEASFLGQKIKFYFVEGRFRGLFGIPPEQQPGNYKMEIDLTREGGSPEKVEKWVDVKPTQFASTWFRLKPAKKKLLVQDLIQDEWARIERILLATDPEQHWSDEFILPGAGPVSMKFGTREYVNGKKRGQHRGLDLAVSSGTEIKAAENGKVVFAGKLKAFGGTVVIDHGQGVHTLYFHLSKFMKAVGEAVEEGEIIALSGNSGISSGPHLHWGMSVNNVRVDPLQWTKYAF